MRSSVLALGLFGLVACTRGGSEGLTGTVADAASPYADAEIADVDVAIPLPDALSSLDATAEVLVDTVSDSVGGDLADGSGDSIGTLDSAENVPGSDTLAVPDAALHIDSKYPDWPPDVSLDTQDATPYVPDISFDVNASDCPMGLSTWADNGGIFCNDTECCWNGVLAGPCGWHFCCAAPEVTTIFSLPSCPAVPLPPPPWPKLSSAPCPQLQQYSVPVVPVCKAECWCD